MENPMRALYTKFICALCEVYQPKLAKDDAGVTAIEYGLIAALVAVVCIAAWSLLGKNLSTTFNTIASSV
jgi:pilus assembly protein Flp/PilA